MLSNVSGSNHNTENTVITEIKVQNVILKAIHDFLEEQKFDHILADFLPRFTSKISMKSTDNLISEIAGKKFSRDRNIVIYHQILLGKLNLQQLYSVGKQPNHSSIIEIPIVDIESQLLSFDEMTMFIEKLLRRIKIDVETKIPELFEDDNIRSYVWKDNFPTISRHDIELEFGDDWPKEATKEFNSPFFVSCVKPKFYDIQDPDRSGDHYLNFDLYLPQIPHPVGNGGQREYRYKNIMQQMKNLGINRYDYTNYLLYVADNTLDSSSGVNLNLPRLISSFCRSFDF